MATSLLSILKYILPLPVSLFCNAQHTFGLLLPNWAVIPLTFWALLELVALQIMYLCSHSGLFARWKYHLLTQSMGYGQHFLGHLEKLLVREQFSLFRTLESG